ncbi:hypothetical protein HOC37_05140 [bacterium]|jgi:hypothetical protein|nr:hypothetical protein [bacterium]MBT3581238.1 hypothetical protein [bacterium]MBT4552347.1 hypothetical protein [bacterium]MBT5988979.1 hypothetical protein [bacterium]MBT7087871.1 hypothetical protein [bacterium]
MIKSLLNKSLEIIKKDTLILTPYLFFFMIFNFWQPATLKWTLALIFVAGLIELFFKTFTLIMAKTFHESQSFSYKTIIGATWAKYPKLFLSSCVLLLPLIPFVYIVKTIAIFDILKVIILLIVILPIALFLKFLPVFILMQEKKWPSIFHNMLLFFKNNYSKIIVFLGLTISINILTTILRLIFIKIPYIGPTLQIIPLALSATFVAILEYNFYIAYYKSSKTIDTAA